MAAKCGVDAIPFLVLVDQGITIALHVRGGEAGRGLAELLGPVADPVSPAPSLDGLPGAPTGGLPGAP